MNNDAPITLVLDGIWGRPKRFIPLLEMVRQRVGPAELHYYNSSGLEVFERLGLQLAATIRKLGRPVNLIGFSMGGLVLRAAHLADPALPVKRVAYMNSPLAGSMLAHLCPIRGMRQMRPNDDFVKRVEADVWNIPTLVTWCPGDTMIIPNRSAKLATADVTVRCAVPMHIWPMLSRGIWRQLVDFLATPVKALSSG